MMKYLLTEFLFIMQKIVSTIQTTTNVYEKLIIYQANEIFEYVYGSLILQLISVHPVYYEVCLKSFCFHLVEISYI